jgi:hypothetical protein
MSFTNQSGDLSPFTEVVPESAALGGLTKSSILTSRRRGRITPQTGSSYGSLGSGAASSQIQFLLADQGGLIDMRSISINYAIQVASASNDATCVPDDGHVFSTVQIALNGQLLENIQNAMKLSNIEMKMGGSRTYYQSAGSMQGWELLNPDLTSTVALGSTSVTAAMMPQWGYVANNVTDLSARCRRAAAAAWNNIPGEFRSIPLGLISGLGRIKQYLPVAILGELTFTLITGQNGEVMFQTGSTTDATYSLSNVTMTYDVVVPDQRYVDLLKKVATEPEGHGLTMPFESSIVTTGGQITGSSTSLGETSVIVSRATNNLLRTSVVQIPSSLLASQAYPSQSCFSHAMTYSVQWRIGSQTYPLIAAQGDSDLFNTALEAYGSVEQSNGSVINRALWGNSTNATSSGVAAVYETAQQASGGTVKFAYADSFIPSFGFRTVKGSSEPLDVDGVSLAGASGSQLVTTIVSAPANAYTPYVSLVALKFIRARGGAVEVAGA